MFIFCTAVVLIKFKLRGTCIHMQMFEIDDLKQTLYMKTANTGLDGADGREPALLWRSQVQIQV